MHAHIAVGPKRRAGAGRVRHGAESGGSAARGGRPSGAALLGNAKTKETEIGHETSHAVISWAETLGIATEECPLLEDFGARVDLDVTKALQRRAVGNDFVMHRFRRRQPHCLPCRPHPKGCFIAFHLLQARVVALDAKALPNCVGEIL